MKVVIAPDSFKGSLTARDAALAMAAGVRRAIPDAEIVLLPLGDGGEGTVDALLTAVPGSRKVPCRVVGPMGEPVKACYALLGAQGKVAVVEMSAAAGLNLVPPDLRDPRETTTYGVGELICYAAGEPAVERLIVGLGGSATNDSGAGAMQALGISFFDRTGAEIAAPIRARDLPRVVRAARSTAALEPDTIDLVLACDVRNPLCGSNGSSWVFGPQKGATPEIAQDLDTILSGFAPILDRIAGGTAADTAIAERPGAGAAGGLAAGLMAYFPAARVQPGIEIVLDAIGFEAALAGADLVVTGEGRLDSQTLGGKAVCGVLDRTLAAGVPVIAFAGEVEEAAAQALYGKGLKGAFAILPYAVSREDAIARAAELLEAAVTEAIEPGATDTIAAEPHKTPDRSGAVEG